MMTHNVARGVILELPTLIKADRTISNDLGLLSKLLTKRIHEVIENTWMCVKIYSKLTNLDKY